MSNKYNKRTLVQVNPFVNSGILYGFNSAADASQRTQLGQTEVDLSTPPPGLVIGANAPKPGRASKVFATTITSSFYDIAQVATLKTADWRIVSKPTIRRGKPQPKAKAVVITVNQVKYAWNMPNETYNAIGASDRAALGISDADSNDKNLVWGASYPKLARASTFVTGGAGGGNIVSTFVDPTKVDNLPAGWGTSGQEYA